MIDILVERKDDGIDISTSSACCNAFETLQELYIALKVSAEQVEKSTCGKINAEQFLFKMAETILNDGDGLELEDVKINTIFR